MDGSSAMGQHKTVGGLLAPAESDRPGAQILSSPDCFNCLNAFVTLRQVGDCPWCGGDVCRPDQGGVNSNPSRSS